MKDGSLPSVRKDETYALVRRKSFAQNGLPESIMYPSA